MSRDIYGPSLRKVSDTRHRRAAHQRDVRGVGRIGGMQKVIAVYLYQPARRGIAESESESQRPITKPENIRSLLLQ